MISSFLVNSQLWVFFGLLTAGDGKVKGRERITGQDERLKEVRMTACDIIDNRHRDLFIRGG